MADRRRTRGRSGSTEFPSSGAVEEQLSGPDGPPSSSPTATPSACLDPSPSLSGGEELLWTGAAVAAPSPTSAVVPGPLPLRRRRDLGRCDRLELACDDAELAYMPKPAELLPFRVGARRWFGCMRRSKCGACANSDERGPRHRRIQRKWEASFFLSSASSTPQRGENWKSLLQGLFQFTSADGVRQLGRHRMKGACS
jgi:hypothetical protein